MNDFFDDSIVIRNAPILDITPVEKSPRKIVLPTTSKKQILVLRIYSNNKSYYSQMKEVHDLHDTKIAYDNIDIFYVTYDNTLTDESPVVLDGNIVKVKGEESLLNILDKTVKALEFLCARKKYDYIVRSNISIFINYPLLESKINELPSNNVYTGGFLFYLTWTNPSHGVLQKHTGNFFSGGSALIMSNDVVMDLLENKHKLDYSVVDDVSIGCYITKHNLPATMFLVQDYIKAFHNKNFYKFAQNPDSYAMLKDCDLGMSLNEKTEKETVFIRNKVNPQHVIQKLKDYYISNFPQLIISQ